MVITDLKHLYLRAAAMIAGGLFHPAASYNRSPGMFPLNASQAAHTVMYIYHRSNGRQQVHQPQG